MRPEPDPPLAGTRVVITRPADQAGSLVEAFAAAGAEVACLPLLAVVPPADPAPLNTALASIEDFDRLIFSSPNAVAAVLPACEHRRVPPIAVIGPATAAAVRAAGGTVAREAVRRDAGGLVDALTRDVRGQRILLPLAADARPQLAHGLRAAGAEVQAVIAYAKILPADAEAQARKIFARRPLGWVTFTSPSIVRHFIELLGDDWPQRRPQLRAAAIGRTTAEALRRRGVRPAVAREPTPGALVQAVIRAHSEHLRSMSGAP